jgi:hypothetical protein
MRLLRPSARAFGEPLCVVNGRETSKGWRWTTLTIKAATDTVWTGSKTEHHSNIRRLIRISTSLAHRSYIGDRTRNRPLHLEQHPAGGALLPAGDRGMNQGSVRCEVPFPTRLGGPLFHWSSGARIASFAPRLSHFWKPDCCHDLPDCCRTENPVDQEKKPQRPCCSVRLGRGVHLDSLPHSYIPMLGWALN